MTNDVQQLKESLRSSTLRNETIKVVYFGERYGGFHYGHMIEATASAVRRTTEPFPYPKHRYSNYEIKDADGDRFPVSRDGEHFVDGFYPVPESVEGKYVEKER